MTEKPKLPAAAERQQWVLDPHHPSGFRLVDLPVSSGSSVVWDPPPVDDGSWPPQKGPPSAAPPVIVCRLDGVPEPEEPDPWGLPTYEPFSLAGRDALWAYELVLVAEDWDPNSPLFRELLDDPHRAGDRLETMLKQAPKATRNLRRDIDDGVIRPRTEGWDYLRGKPDESTDSFAIADADAFARRIGSDRWAVLWAEREKKPSPQSAGFEIGATSKQTRPRGGPPPPATQSVPAETQTNNRKATARTPTITPGDTQRILKKLGPMPAGKAWDAVKDEVKKAVKNGASDKHVPRSRIRTAIKALGWKRRRGKPGNNTPE